MKKPLKTKNKPCIVIFGEGDKQPIAKAILPLLSSYDLQFSSISSIAELEKIASGAVLVLVFIQSESDKNNELARLLISNPRVICDIVAMANITSVEDRIKILANGFDTIFNLGFMDYPDFKQVLLNRIEKGFAGLENRIQQEEHRRLKAALDSTPDAFIVFDEHDKIFFAGEHFKRAYPVNGHRLVRGMGVMEAFEVCGKEQGLIKGDRRHKIMRDFWTALDGEAEFKMDNGRIWHIKAKKLYGGQGTIVTTMDVTHYKDQQQELEEKSKTLADTLEKEQEAGAVQKQFVNMVSHEFRTPLAIIDGHAQILKRQKDRLNSEEIEKRAKAIRSAVSRLVNMMEGVLSSNMLKTGRLELVVEPVNIKKLVKELCENHADFSNTRKIECDIDNLPDKAMLDRKLITLVIGNLVSNAIKFTTNSPEIGVKGWQEGDQIFISFQDNGIGIPANELDKIFKRYYRTTTASGIPGSGIGLNLAKDLVELHKGTISVESEIDKGTKFVISMPIRTNEEEST